MYRYNYSVWCQSVLAIQIGMKEFLLSFAKTPREVGLFGKLLSLRPMDLVQLPLFSTF